MSTLAHWICLAAAMASLLTACTGQKSDLERFQEEMFPGDWQAERHTAINETLKHEYVECSPFEWIQSAEHEHMFMVRCTGGGQSGNHYLVNTTDDLVSYVGVAE